MLDFKDNTDIEKLIEKMFNRALSEPERKVKYIDYEIEKNIYSYRKK